MEMSSPIAIPPESHASLKRDVTLLDFDVEVSGRLLDEMLRYPGLYHWPFFVVSSRWDDVTEKIDGGL